MNSFQEVGLPLINASITPAYSKQPSSYSETYYQPKTENSTSQPAAYCGSGYQDLGLPVVEISPNGNDRNGTTPTHRRCSSSPAETVSRNSKNSASFQSTGEMLRVLWV
jgi:hypothetical protein